MNFSYGKHGLILTLKPGRYSGILLLVLSEKVQLDFESNEARLGIDVLRTRLVSSHQRCELQFAIIMICQIFA